MIWVSPCGADFGSVLIGAIRGVELFEEVFRSIGDAMPNIFIDVKFVFGNGSGRTESVTEPAKCHGAPDYSCSAFRSLKILFTGGSCTGKPYADCKVMLRENCLLHFVALWKLVWIREFEALMNTFGVVCRQ